MSERLAPTAVAPPRADTGSVGLAGSLRRINALLPETALRLRFGVPAIGVGTTLRGWHRCDELLAHERGFDAWHRGMKVWLREQHGKSPDRTAAGYVRAWYLGAIGAFAAQLFHHERRVPSLRPEDLALRITAEGRPYPDAVAVRVAEFACLPDDPAAGTKAATVVASEQALAALLRARFAGHAARFATGYRPPVHFGRHTVWGAATDALDSGLWLAGRLGGDEGAGVADAALVLPAQIEPFTSASTLHRAAPPPDGDSVPQREWTRRRETCCFHYLVSSGSQACGTCPRVKPKG